MATKQQVSVGSLEVGDVAVFVEGDVPFLVMAVSDPVSEVRQLDLSPVRGGRSRTRVTAWVHQGVSLLGREPDTASREPAVAAAG